MRNHGLYPKDFWSELRDEEVQAARRAVAKRLFLEARYHPILIGRCLGRSETTVLHYLKQLGNFAVVLREINAREREFKDDDQTI